MAPPHRCVALMAAVAAAVLLLTLDVPVTLASVENSPAVMEDRVSQRSPHSVKPISFAVTEAERVNTLKVLQAFAAAMPSLGWRGDNFCSWRDIACFDGNVSLIVTRLSAPGTLPEMPDDVDYSMVRLDEINLFGGEKSVFGTLPHSWGKLMKVRTINLAYTGISGTLPAAWSSMTAVEEIVLTSTNITGTLPAAWSTMPNLGRIHFQRCNLFGSLPASWARMPSLERVSLHKNHFCGCLPKTWLTSPILMTGVDARHRMANCLTAEACAEMNMTEPITSSSSTTMILEPNKLPTTPTAAEPSTPPMASTTAEPSTLPVTPTAAEPSTPPVTPTAAEPSTPPVTPTAAEPSTPPLTTTTAEPSTPPVMPTAAEPSTPPVTSTTAEPSTPSVTPTTAEPSTPPVTPTAAEPSTPPVTPTAAEPSTPPVTPTTDGASAGSTSAETKAFSDNQAMGVPPAPAAAQCNVSMCGECLPGHMGRCGVCIDGYVLTDDWQCMKSASSMKPKPFLMSEAERVNTLKVLQAFSAAMPSLRWSGDDFCSWSGVRCTGANVSMIITRLWVTGTLPEMPDDVDYSMVRLHQIHLFGQHSGILGTLPSSWGKLRKVRTINLAYTGISGTLPNEWSSMEAIEQIILFNTEITGTLPEAWSALLSLRRMYLHGCNLYGSLPASWARMPSLERLALQDNHFCGCVPESWLSSPTLVMGVDARHRMADCATAEACTEIGSTQSTTRNSSTTTTAEPTTRPPTLSNMTTAPSTTPKAQCNLFKLKRCPSETEKWCMVCASP